MAAEVSEKILRLIVQEEVTSKFKAMQSEMDRMQGGLGSAQNAVKGFFGVFGVGSLSMAAAGAGLGLFIKSSVEAASRLQEVQNRAEVAFGDAFPQVRAEIEAMAVTLRRSDGDLLEMASGFQMVGEAMGYSSGLANEMSVNLTRLSVDFSKALGGTQEDAARALEGAIRGNTKALADYGVVIKPGTLDQYAFSKGIDDTVESMSDAQKSLLTYQYVLENTGKIQEMAARNTGGLRDETERLSAAWEDLKEQMGQDLAGPAADGLSGLTEMLRLARIEAIGLRGDIEALLAPLSKGLSEAGGNLVKNLGLSSDTTAIDSVIDLYGGGFADAAGEAFTGIGEAASGAETDVKSLYETMNKGRPGGGGGADSAAEKLDKVKDSMEDLGRSYADESRSIDQDIKKLEQAHKDGMKSIAEEIDGVTESLQRLQSEYAKATADMDRREADSVASQEDRVRVLRDRVETLRQDNGLYGFDEKATMVIANRKQEDQGREITGREAREYNLTEKQVEMLDARIELAREERALEDYRASGGGAGLDLGAARERAQGSGFTTEVEDMRRQRTERLQGFQEEVASQQKTLDKLREKKTLEEEVYLNSRQQFELTRITMQGFQTDYNAAMLDIDKVTQDTVKSLKTRLEEMRDTISSIDALVAARSDLTGGGSVADRRRARLDVTPDSFLHPAASSVDKSVTISIGTVNVKDEKDAQALIDRIKEELTRAMQLQSLSSS